MTKIERALALLDEAAEEIRDGTILDIRSTLIDFLGSADETEQSGLRAAIEIIDANYPTTH